MYFFCERLFLCYALSTPYIIYKVEKQHVLIVFKCKYLQTYAFFSTYATLWIRNLQVLIQLLSIRNVSSQRFFFIFLAL